LEIAGRLDGVISGQFSVFGRQEEEGRTRLNQTLSGLKPPNPPLERGEILSGIPGTCILVKEKPLDGVELDGYDVVKAQDGFYRMSKAFHDNYLNRTMYYQHLDRYLVHYMPAEPLSMEEIDEVYNMSFMREPHPMYKGKVIKAFEQIKYSILSHRGCYGGCNFCIIGFHQGKVIQSRSKSSILKEVERLVKKTYFKGTVTDVAGASANMYGSYCKACLNTKNTKDTQSSQRCFKRSCLYPEICKNLVFDEKEYLSVLNAVRGMKKVENVFISSGVRFDLALMQPEFMNSLCFYHVSGLLKLAPEHVSEKVLRLMYKPVVGKFIKFVEIFDRISKKVDKKQRVLPYLIVGFPGCTMAEAQELASFLKKNDIRVEQIQEFTPTPMTIATVMYFTGRDFETGEAIYVPKGRELTQQKELAQWFMRKKLGIRN
jgi:uncharacterized radical SAM protein YgiQ